MSIKVRDADNKTLGWVDVAPSGEVRLAGFSETLGRIQSTPGGNWGSFDLQETYVIHKTRAKALTHLWLDRERRLQAAGR